MKRTGVLSILSNAIGGALCGCGLHKWCPHPATESYAISFRDPDSGKWKLETAFRCQKCGCAMERFLATGKFHPVDDAKVCLRCGIVCTPD